MKSTKDNLRNHATMPLEQLLVHSAKSRSSTTYGEAKLFLETEVGFDTIFSTMMGVPAGEINNRFLAIRPGCPPLTVLLVRQVDRMPGEGAGLRVPQPEPVPADGVVARLCGVTALRPLRLSARKNGPGRAISDCADRP